MIEGRKRKNSKNGGDRGKQRKTDRINVRLFAGVLKITRFPMIEWSRRVFVLQSNISISSSNNQ